MSYAIENLKFTIFGHGYDATRNDSGYGVKSAELSITVYSAVIDSTGRFAWFVTNNGLKKYQTSNWTEVEQDTIPDDCRFVVHPSNVENNYGIATSADGNTAYVFDMTDDTLICSVSGTFSSISGARSWDCILVNDKIYMINRFTGNTNTVLQVIDIDNETCDESVSINGVGLYGFIDDSLIYGAYTREWFYQASCAYAYNFSGVAEWSNTDINRNDNLVQDAIPTNGKLYMPVLIDDTWHFGEFDGTSNPTFNPVTPIRTFGSFDTAPTLTPYISGNNRTPYFCFNDGRTKCCMLTAEGVLLTDFSKVEVIDSAKIPLAMNDQIIIISDYENNKLYVYGY